MRYLTIRDLGESKLKVENKINYKSPQPFNYNCQPTPTIIFVLASPLLFIDDNIRLCSNNITFSSK